MIKVSFWGDCKIDDINSVEVNEQIKSILSDCNLNVINFEAPVHSSGNCINKSGPHLSQSNDTPGWLEKNGFNIISLANNHIMDFGEEGYRKTTDAFKTSILVGAGEWKEAYNLKIKEINRKKIGFLSFTHCEFGTLTDKYDRKQEIGSAWICHPEVPSIIVEGKKKVDFLFILPHAGIENIDVPLPEWREKYRSFIDLGADAVVATHPHVPQGWEIYRGKPIFYSLGNFCFHKMNTKKLKPFWNNSLSVIFIIDLNSQINFEIKNVCYNGKNLEIINSIEIINHINNINNYLINDEIYLNKVNTYCKELLSNYKNIFSAGGYHYAVSFNSKLFRKLISIFLGKIKYNHAHTINNIRCESHRWAFLRASELI